MRVVAVGAHPDDIEFGCGGTLTRHAEAGDNITLVVLTTGEPDDAPVRRAEQEAACALLGAKLIWSGIQRGRPVGGPETIEIITSAATEADLAYLPTPHDAHQVHVATAVAALTAVRRTPNILHYEGPSSHQFSPNSFVKLNADTLARKHALLEKHGSQVSVGRLDVAAVDILASYRGLQAGVTHAEGFEVNRIRWNSRPQLP